MNTSIGQEPLASPAQIRLLTNLLAKHDVPEAFVESLRERYRAAELTKSYMSTALSLIDSLPLKESEAITVERPVLLLHGRTLIRVAPTADGGYRTSLYKTMKGHAPTFIDKHVAVSILRSSRILTNSEAERFAKSTGLCGTCGFKLAGQGARSHTACLKHRSTNQV